MLLAALGADMTVFPTAAHAVSWAGLSRPAPKRPETTARAHTPWPSLAPQDPPPGGLSRDPQKRLRPRGPLLSHSPSPWAQKAAIAVANALVVTADTSSRDCDYQELGADYLDRRSTERTQQRAVRALERLGYRVTLEKAA